MKDSTNQIPTMAEAKEIFDFAKKIEGIFKTELGVGEK